MARTTFKPLWAILILLALPVAIALAADGQPVKKVGWLELSGPIVEGPAPYSMGQIENERLTLSVLINRLNDVAADPSFAGVIVYLDDPWLNFHHIDALAAAFEKLQAADKPVIAFAQHYSLPSYLLACEADLVLLQHKGEINIFGLLMEELYLKGLLEKVGAKADYVQVGRFKGADESMTRSAPSDAWSTNIDGLLDDLYDQTVTRIAERRKMNRKAVESFIGNSFAMTDEQYLKQKAVDRLVDRDLLEVTSEQFGDDFQWHDMTMPLKPKKQPANPFMLFAALMNETERKATRNTIAVLHIDGPIVPGESNGSSPQASLLFADKMVGNRTITKAINEISEDSFVKGVVIRVESPGGSALASEMIWQAIHELAEFKPVYVSIGSTAASGGYYVASAADQIYAHPSSIVGSIGVVGGKVVFGNLYEKIGLTVTRRSRGPQADMFNSVTPFDDAQRKVFKAGIERVYDQFLDRITKGRGDRVENLDAVAQGRIFTGRQAKENGLVDRLGSLDVAVTDMAESLKLQPGSYDTLNYPAPLPFGVYLGRLLGADVSAAAPTLPGSLVEQSTAVQAAKQLVGPRHWPTVQRSLVGLMLLRSEPILAIMPDPILFR